MKMKNLTLIFLFAPAALLFSCNKDQDIPGVTYQVRTANPSAAIIASTTGSTLTWNSGYASTVEIEFEAAKEGLEVEYKSEARKKVDLFSSLATLGTIVVPPGTYEDVEFEVEIQPTATDAALQLGGIFKNGSGVSTPVIFKLNETVEIESERENITITDASSLTALSTINLSFLTTGVSEDMLNAATRNSSGAIEISANTNTAIYTIMRDNLKSCGGVEID